MFGKENVEYFEIFRFFFQNEIFNLNWFFCAEATKGTTIHGSWTVAQAYGIKPSCYWEVGEHFGNTVGTLREKKERKKLLPSQNPKEKKTGPPNACWAFSLATWNFYFFKTICHQLWPGLITPL